MATGPYLRMKILAKSQAEADESLSNIHTQQKKGKLRKEQQNISLAHALLQRAVGGTAVDDTRIMKPSTPFHFCYINHVRLSVADKITTKKKPCGCNVGTYRTYISNLDNLHKYVS